MKFGANDARLQGIRIPPSAVVFSVGLETAEIDEGVETNPRTGELEYRKITEAIGRKRAPTSVTYSSPTLSMVVDSLFDGAGPTPKDHTGRKVRVWLKSTQDGGLVGPKSSIEAVAFEELTVSYVGNNKITLAGKLGQDTGTPSTTASDYWVQIVGPTVTTKTVEDLISTSGAVFLAEVTGVGGVGGVIPGGNIATAAQRIIAFSLADTSDVLRRDSHGFVKVRVKADASDAEEPQLEVQNFAGTTVFKVDEDGDITAVSVTASPGGSTNQVGVTGTGGLTNGIGVLGNGSGTGSGVKGAGGGSAATGVEGVGGSAGYGLKGTGGSAGGTVAAGVRGNGGAGGSYGVDGAGTTSFPGVRGVGGSSGSGVEGYGGGGNANGVVGAGAGSGAGILGQGGPTNGYGVKGQGIASGYGVYGVSDTSGGAPGVRGEGGIGSNGDGVSGQGDGVGAGGYFVCGTGRKAIDLTGTIDLAEESSEPSTPGANKARLYLRDDGSGYSQLAIKWPDGSITTIATQV